MEIPQLNNKLFLLYPMILVVGTLIQQTGIFQFAKGWYFIQSKNFINKIFAGNAYIFLLIILLSVSLLKLVELHDDMPMLPLNNSNLHQDLTLKKLAIKRSCKIALVFVDLNLVLNYDIGIFNVITRHTQHCSIKEFTNSETCLANDGEWSKGFDPSGHYFLLITVSMITINELQKILGEHKYHNDILNKLKDVIIYMGITLLVIWLELFTITSIFYHTIAEKSVGFTMAVTITTLINNL